MNWGKLTQDELFPFFKNLHILRVYRFRIFSHQLIRKEKIKTKNEKKNVIKTTKNGVIFIRKYENSKLLKIVNVINCIGKNIWLT